MPAKNKSSAALLAQISRTFLRPGERLGVAVSGGADSVALLLLLLELREKIGFVPCVLHFNHKLRGKASDADEKFVAALAKKHHLEFFVDREDVAAKSRRERSNLEDAARRARYAFFDRLVNRGRVSRVAVAQSADDQAETVLAHILRGTGLAGLAGIHPQSGAIFRPLLAARRAALRSYLRANRQTWREDATNRDTARNRAHIRLKLMPLLEKRFQPAVVAHLCQLAELAREDDAYLEMQTASLAKSLVQTSSQNLRIALAELLSQPRALQARLIRHLVDAAKPRSGQLSAAHVDSVLRLAADRDSGKSLRLPGGVEVRRDRDALSLLPDRNPHLTKQSSHSSQQEYSYPVDLRPGEATLAIVELSVVLRLRVIDCLAEGRETSGTGAVLDRNKLRRPLVVRNWRPGDALRPVGHQKRHKLARLLNELGVNRWEKISWPVLTDGESILWARGLPVAAEFAAGSATRASVVITEERES